MATIDALWDDLRNIGQTKLHRRVDDHHPLDLYAEFEPPAYPGLVLFCPARPPEPRQMKTIAIERGQRPDGLWWLRLSLQEPSLHTVFAGLSQDIIAFTRSGVSAEAAPAAILGRVERWRALLEGDRGGLSASELRGLIGELLVLQSLLDRHPLVEAVSSWNGPLGSPQDFMLPDGLRIEVKTTQPDADTFRVNGLGQLDPGADPMELRMFRLADASLETEGAMTAAAIIDSLRGQLESEPLALNEFNSRLAAIRWHDHPRHREYAVRLAGVHCYRVVEGFPRIVAADVPVGIDDVSYLVELSAASDFEMTGGIE
ncbi:MAG TPA: PD-(D/E)XK motif protein [Candidatus Sulfotelmatobacter sp.]|nr:PD-(D/E)XK motif protein [Candidatus Sulfotelmatobacter sp.]